MFRKNEGHLQHSLFSDLDKLSDKQRQRLGQSWAGSFYREFFCRLDETAFSCLYSEEASRPNIPVNVLVGLEMMKAGFGWSDAELYDQFCFSLQVRYALGLSNLGEGEFELRTLYNFRRRLSEHMQQTGINLLDTALAQVTDEQVKAFGLATHCLRMDSTQVASNIRQYTRLQLLVEVLQRAARLLTEDQRASYAQELAPYLEGSSGQFLHRLKPQDTALHMHAIGQLMQRLLGELASTHDAHPTYQILARVFGEQFDVQEQVVQAKAGQDIAPSSLRSPDDSQATFRRKGSAQYEGYVANVTETAATDNPFQLVVRVQVAPNNTEDTTLLAQALPELKARTGVETLYSDGGYCGQEADLALAQQQVMQVPTDLPGKQPDPNRLHLADFRFQLDERGEVLLVRCPQGQTSTALPSPSGKYRLCQFGPSACQDCPHQGRCPTYVCRRDGRRTLRFSPRQLAVALRRRRCLSYREEGKHLRTAIEAVMGAIKRPFKDDQLPVRGCFRVACMLLGAGMMVNIRRITRYLAGKGSPDQAQGAQLAQADKSQGPSFLSVVPALAMLLRLFLPRRAFAPIGH